MSYLSQGPSSIAGVSDTGALKGDPGFVAAAKRQSMIKKGDLADDFALFTASAKIPDWFPAPEYDEVA